MLPAHKTPVEIRTAVKKRNLFQIPFLLHMWLKVKFPYKIMVVSGGIRYHV